MVGENGAGKSTLMGTLAGSVHRDGGEIEIDGVLLPGARPRPPAALGIAMVSQEFPLVGQLSVAENLLLGRRPHGCQARGPWSTGPRPRAEAEADARRHRP